MLTAMNGVPWWFFQRSDRPLAGTALASIDPTGEIAASIPSANVIGCVVHAACSVDAPGLIRHKMGTGAAHHRRTGRSGAKVARAASKGASVGVAYSAHGSGLWSEASAISSAMSGSSCGAT